jgi:hypothetical protein
MGQGTNSPENNLITVFASKEIKSLYKTFLELVEDLKNDQKIMLDKVAAQCGEKFAHDINSFTPEKYEQVRKRILDSGNECSRRLLNFLDFFDFIINKEKVESAARENRVVTKKVIISPAIQIE